MTWGSSLVIFWLRFWAPFTGGLGRIPGQGTRSHMPQLKILYVTTKTWHSQPDTVTGFKKHWISNSFDGSLANWNRWLKSSSSRDGDSDTEQACDESGTTFFLKCEYGVSISGWIYFVWGFHFFGCAAQHMGS